MFLFFSAFSCDFSHESVLSWSCLIYSNFPFNLLFIRSTLHWLNFCSLRSHLPGYLFCMRTTSGNSSIYKLLDWSMFLPSLLLRPYLPWGTDPLNSAQFVLVFSFFYFFFLALKLMRSSKWYQKKVFKKYLPQVPSPQTLPVESRI